MTFPEHSNEDPGDSLPTSNSEGTSAAPDALIRALEMFQEAVSANNTAHMESAALDALAAAADEAGKNATPQNLLGREAAESEAQGDWLGAEGAYRKILALPEAASQAGLLFKAQYDLSRLFLLVGNLENADDFARTATVSARQTRITPVLVMALVNQAICALRCSDSTNALEAVEPGRMSDGVRAEALVTRARCRAALGDLPGSQDDLAACKPLLLDQEVSALFAGRHKSAAGWWEVTAGLRARQGDPHGACEAWSEAVQRRRHVASLEHVSGPHTLAGLARSLRGLGEALDAAGEPEDGHTYKEEARRIWSELGLPEPV